MPQATLVRIGGEIDDIGASETLPIADHPILPNSAYQILSLSLPLSLRQLLETRSTM